MDKMKPITNMTENEIKLLFSVSDDVIIERHNQQTKWGTQRHHDSAWYLIFMEEVGEIAEALQPSMGLKTGKETDAQHLEEEIIQASAVLNAWAEQLREFRELNQRLNSE